MIPQGARDVIYGIVGIRFERYMHNMNEGPTDMKVSGQAPKFLAVDFYCGAGGTTRGLLDAGGYVIAGVDKDPDCKQTYKDNNRNKTLDLRKPEYLEMDMFPQSENYPGGQQEEIVDYLQELLSKYLSGPLKQLPLLFAVCAPCQSFTKFVQRNLSQEREDGRERDGTLLHQTLQMIDQFGPDVVLSENVIGANRGAFRESWNKYWAELQARGYAVGERVVSADKFGIPQKRRRLIGIAVKTPRDNTMQLDGRIPNEDEVATLKSVSDAIGGLPPLQAGESSDYHVNHRCRNVSSLNRERLLALEPGETNRNFTETLSLPCHNRLARDKGNGFVDPYTRMRPDLPAPTLTTRFISISNGRFGHYDSNQGRGLSLLEGALLQSFNEKYVFHGSNMDTVAKMIGNAVPPKLAEFMAFTAIRLWQEEQITPTR